MIDNFENGIAELLEVDSVNDEEVLEDFESWDSLTSLSIIAFIDENYKVSITRKDLMNAKTIGGLKQLILSKSKSA
jgi:acyl carrier protein